MTPNQITAVLVTRGDVDLEPVHESIEAAGITSILVWDNSLLEHLDVKVWGRYAPIFTAAFDDRTVYVQDDDCIIPVADVVAAYTPGRLVANMPRSRWPDYPDSAMVGWGAVFDADLVRRAFGVFETAMRIGTITQDESERYDLHRTCDVIFSALTPRTVIDVGFQHLPWAETETRMFRQPGHKEGRDFTLDICRRIRGDDDDIREAR